MTGPVNLWRRKFGDAIRGCRGAFAGEISFHVHLSVAALVIALAAWLGIEPWRWAAVIVCIAGVIAAELLNTAIEGLAAAVHPSHDSGVGRALDAAAGAVLVWAIGSVAVGLVALAGPLIRALGWMS